MDGHRELGSFLKSRRARVKPADHGLTGGRRRVPGLRREEVAQLAGISVEYYVRLEQGRANRPSDEVLAALTHALELDDTERLHLQDLSRARRAVPRGRTATDTARAELVQLLATFEAVPALLINYRFDVLAWNRLAATLFFDFETASPKGRNLARFGFLDPLAQQRFVDWYDVARATVGQLRLAAGRHPHDEGLATLLGELTMRSETFRRLWSQRDVRERTHGVKRFHHPLVGEVPLRFENFNLPDGGQRLVVFFPEPGSEAQRAMQLLAMWNAPEAIRSQPTARHPEG
ncbi:helix-turn-helix domain-containing protein [Actinoplanes regularis]|uniref:Transcriptional regulator, contains XRE-family HTH domain n=1 Tax=Actinoplanes regularis TaxID=52697 RepID=A0A238YRA0_9ACTN|nr:helix-turn-helix transcriptional regulator [Actinoplanes regularis]SNR73338.1 Transcriptional regulator, contains XRE-family HTH domain [Actinoplanes regularis]